MPSPPTTTPEADAVAATVVRHESRPDRLLEMLHDLQHDFGFVPPACVEPLAEALNLSRAEIHGVITYYHDFRTTPGGRTIVHVCRAEACQAVGSRALEAHARQRLGLEFGQVGDDGAFELRETFCLGNCACGPSIRIGDRIHARVTPERFDALIDSEVDR